MKVFISQPMNGLSFDEIKNNREKIVKEIEERYPGLVFDVADTLFVEEPDDVYKIYNLYYLGRSIQELGKCDAIYFASDWHNARGCKIERQIAEDYGITILNDYEFGKDIYDE